MTISTLADPEHDIFFQYNIQYTDFRFFPSCTVAKILQFPGGGG